MKNLMYFLTLGPSLIAMLLMSTIDGYESFGVFAAGLTWILVVAGFIPMFSVELAENIRQKRTKRAWLQKVLSPVFAIALIFTLIGTGYPITAVFYTIAVIMLRITTGKQEVDSSS